MKKNEIAMLSLAMATRSIDSSFVLMIPFQEKVVVKQNTAEASGMTLEQYGNAGNIEVHLATFNLTVTSAERYSA